MSLSPTLKALGGAVAIAGVAAAWWFLRPLPQLAAPAGAPYVKPVPDDWGAYQAENRTRIAAHIAHHADDFTGFARYAVSRSDGIPYLILNLLPRLAPEFWGPKDDFLSVMGLFHDPRLGDYPMPLGIGISGLNRAVNGEDPNGRLDYASFTCGGCHVGRVRLDDGSIDSLNGGINAEFDVIGYRLRIVETLNKLYAGETDPARRKARVLERVLAELDAAEAESPTYFYRGYTFDDGRGGPVTRFDAAYEAAQIALFRRDAATYVAAFVDHQEQVYTGWKVIVERNYRGIETATLKGFPGMEDAISFNAAHAYQGLKAEWYTAPFAFLALPDIAAVTDIMAVWDQKTRDPLGWNAERTRLVDGGGQWNGHIPMLLYKNLAAQLTLGFDDVDVAVSAHAERLLYDLPAPAYPFPVDVALARRGEALFAEHCADCHRPNNGRVYRDIGTHPGRAEISGTIITLGAQLSFTGNCGPDTEILLSGERVKPCAEYKGVSLKGHRDQSMTDPRQHDGYNALPLVGIWAQAPYLHNGSVPTLYHLLIPRERPGEFIKSRLDYDTRKVGFSWDPKVASRGAPGEGYVYRPSASPIIGAQGHDRDLTLDGRTYKLDWSDDRDGAMALLEYLKTL